MSNSSDLQRQTEQHLQLWIYFLPVVGIIPAIWTLVQAKSETPQKQNNPFIDSGEALQQLKASRLSLNLTLIWLCSYLLLSCGAVDGTEIMTFRFLYANAIITTGYFVACTFMMSRLGKKKRFFAE